jgi:ADP-ribosylglycohydrolase
MPLIGRTAQFSDRVLGCILGGAIGDAMGGQFEQQPGSIQPREYADWSISDDTQLTLATCESIIRAGEVSPEQIAARFVLWFRARRITGIGASTLKALRDLDAGAHWALAGARGEMSAGNGAAMRIAPLAFLRDPANTKQRQIIRDVCRLTHHNEEAYIGALAIVMAIRTLALGQSSSPDVLLNDIVSLLPDSRVRDRIVELSRLPNDMTVGEVASQFGSSGYVVDSVPLALYAAGSITRLSFADVLHSTIEAGGDTDTIASMTGQIVGTWIGASRIPRELIELLPEARNIERTATEFAATIGSVL